MSDHEATAKRLLPCMPLCHKAFVDNDKIIHMAECPFIYRPVVAAALASRDAEIERLKTLLKKEALKRKGVTLT